MWRDIGEERRARPEGGEGENLEACELLTYLGLSSCSDGSLAWKQKDGFMFYCGSGYKYNAGKRMEFTPARPIARVAHVGDRVGFLVDTGPMSRLKPTGQSITLYINSVNQGLMFSEKMMKASDPNFEWPHTLHFAMDTKDPGQRVRPLPPCRPFPPCVPCCLAQLSPDACGPARVRPLRRARAGEAIDACGPAQVRLLRHRTFFSPERSTRFSDMAWLNNGRVGAGECADYGPGTVGRWARDSASDKTWLDGDL